MVVVMVHDVGLRFSVVTFPRRRDGLLAASWPPSEPSFFRQTGWARFLQPATAPCGMQSLGFGLPVVESSRDANRGGRRMREFKANGHEFGLGVAGIVMVMIVFHRFEFDWCLRRYLFAETFRS